MRLVLATAVLLSAGAHAAPPAPVEVSVLQNSVARGALLEAEDFALDTRSAAQARGALSSEKAVGREASRNLAAGSVVRAPDVVEPRLVRRGEPVSVTVRSSGFAIATPGRALGSGAAGDLVRVVILSTNRTLDGIVEGTGKVRIAAQ